MHRPTTTTIALTLSAVACGLSLWRAAAQAPVIRPLSLVCPPIGQPCPTPEGCYVHQTQEVYYCANLAGSCCQYKHRHFWYRNIATGEACNPADCLDYVLLLKFDNHYCPAWGVCVPDA